MNNPYPVPFANMTREELHHVAHLTGNELALAIIDNYADVLVENEEAQAAIEERDDLECERDDAIREKEGLEDDLEAWRRERDEEAANYERRIEELEAYIQTLGEEVSPE